MNFSNEKFKNFNDEVKGSREIYVLFFFLLYFRSLKDLNQEIKKRIKNLFKNDIFIFLSKKYKTLTLFNN